MSRKESLKNLKDTYQTKTAEWMMEHFSTLFNKVADPVLALLPDDILMHQITTYSYYPAESRPSAIGDYKLEHLFDDEEKACVYVNHEKKHRIIGYRGTDFKNTKDLMSDVQIILGVSGLDKRIAESLAAYDAVRAKYPEYTKRVCGHSLGGTISYIVTVHRQPDRCTVFNPGSAPNTLFTQMLTDTLQHKARTKNVFTYKIIGDIVSTFGFIGTTKIFRLSILDPLALHSCDNFRIPTVTYAPLM